MNLSRLSLLWLLLPLAGCAVFGPPHKAETSYQLAASPASDTLHDPLPLLAVRIDAPLWLDNQEFLYRQDHVDPLRVDRYVDSIWAERPASMLQQRLDYVAALHPAHGPAALQIRLNLLDFSQHFTSASQSEGRLLATAECRENGGKTAIAHTLFDIRQPAPSANAAGGAKALSAASDQLIVQLYEWAKQCLPPEPAKLLAGP